jgi:hypothetical protein
VSVGTIASSGKVWAFTALPVSVERIAAASSME